MPESRFTAAERNDLMTLGDNIVSAPGEVLRFVDEVLLRGPYPDTVLSEVVRRCSESIVSIEDHESILRDVEEEHLTEEEQRQADEDYQRELAEEHARLTNIPPESGVTSTAKFSAAKHLSGIAKSLQLADISSVEMQVRQSADSMSSVIHFAPI